MGTLQNRTIASSYTELLKTAATTGIDATTLDTVEDGDATASALQLSAAAVKSTGTLTSAGNLDVNTDKFTVDATSGNSTVGGTLGVTGQITGNVTGNLKGDVQAADSTSILDSGTDGTDATFTGVASKATQLATARSLSLSGDATGSASFDGTAGAEIATTLASSGVTAGTYGSATASPRIEVDVKGRVTGVSEVTITGGGGGGGGTDASSIQGVGVSATDPTVDGEALVYTGSEYEAVAVVKDANAVSTSTASKVVKRDSSGDFAANIITAALTGNASTATTLATGRDISLTGDVTGTASSFNGSGNASIASTLANSGVTAATYGDANTVAQVVVDAKGRVTTATDVDISIPASQISDAGTAATKDAGDAEWNANKLQGRTVDSSAPSDGQTLSWNNGASQWEPTTGSATNANQLQGRDIQNVAPTDKYPLIWDNGNTRWSPAQVESEGITDAAVTYAKIQNVSATDKILGRSTAGAGVTEEIDCTSAGRALLDDVDASAQRTTLGLTIGTDVAAEAGTAKLATAQTFTAGQRGEVTAVTVSANVATCELDASNNFDVTMQAAASTEITFSNLDSDSVGQSGVIKLSHAGGATTFNSVFKFAGGTAPTVNTSGVDLIAYHVESASRVSAVFHGNMS